MMTLIGNRIARLREKNKLTQYELANKIKISKSVMNRIELGTRPVRDDELKAFSILFKVSSDYLLGITDIPDTIENYKRKVSPSQAVLSMEDRALLDKYHKLPEKIRNKIEARIEVAYEDMIEDNRIKSRNA